jgi:hypothetical protein
MNCQKFEIVAAELARGQMMGAEIRSDAMAHSSNCSNCSSILRDEEMLTRGLRTLAIEMNSLGASPSGEARLLSAFKQRQNVVPMPVTRDRRRYWLAAVAALLLVVFGVVAYQLRNEGIATPPQETAGGPSITPKDKTASVPDSPGSENSKEPDIATPPRRKPRASFNAMLQARARDARNLNNNQVSNHAEVATDFMPLGYMNASTFQDGGQIIRVELPRSRLASFGIPVNMDRYNERVKADILLGVDGMARAIRFVQDKRLE